MCTKDFKAKYGYYPPIGKKVCINCFSDIIGIKNYIKANPIDGDCDYCEKKTIDNIEVANIDDVILHIKNSIEAKYKQADKKLVKCFNSSVKENLFSTLKLLNEEGFGAIDKTLFNDIEKALNKGKPLWREKRSHNENSFRKNRFTWHRFCDLLKHHLRYLMYKVPQNDILPKNSYHGQEPVEILDFIGKTCIDLNLVREVNEGTKIFRCRPNKKNSNFYNVNDLGPPRAKDAIYANRMSPAGIPMFYGAFNEKTALKEVHDDSRPPINITLAEFEVIKSFKVIDFCLFKRPPDIFDWIDVNLRHQNQFLNSLIHDISESIKKDGREHIEYVPTQVVTEYFRHIFRDIENAKVMGIIYPSSKFENGKSVVLFFTQDNFVNDIDLDKKTDINENIYLKLITSTIKTIKP